jgi:hemolysin activation/secretion protein
MLVAKDFDAVLKKYRDKELSMTDLKKIAEELTGVYRSKGFVTTLVYLPAQDISNNIVEFKVTEGRVDGIKVEGGKYAKAQAIQKKVAVEKGQIMDYRRLESNLRTFNRRPDRTVKAVLSPGSQTGTSNILYKVDADKEKQPHHLWVEYNNRGSSYTGKNRFGLGYANNNLFGIEDSLTVRGLVGDENNVYTANVDYNLPVSKYDTRLGAYFAHSHADVGGQFKILSPEGRATVWGVYVSHPWLDKTFVDEPTNSTLNLTSNLTAGFDSVSVWNKLLGEETSHDELRVFKVGASLDEKDESGRAVIGFEIDRGLPDFLGSMAKHDESASRIDAGGDFTKYEFSLGRVTQLPWRSSLILSLRYQYTADALVNYEQMAIGGADSVRGFPENDYLADKGWIATGEIRTPTSWFIPSMLRVPFDKKGTRLTDATQMVWFLDAGKGNLLKPRVGEKADASLVGMGLGLRFELYENLSGRIDVGWPVGHEKPSDKAPYRVHAGLKYEF